MAENEMTEELFVNCIIEMKALSDELHDGWVIQETGDGNKFLTKRERKNCNDTSLTFEYHIVYSVSYAVPKLCFNVIKTDGTQLQLEEAVQYFDIDEREDILKIVTQMDHPYLHIPFLTLHPCKTEELITTILGKSKNLIVSWISTVGPTIKLHLLHEYSKLT